MDFDDLDDEETKQFESLTLDDLWGEELRAAARLGLSKVETPGVCTRIALPSMCAKDVATTVMPSRRDLPAYFEAHGVKAAGLFKEMPASSAIKARLLIFYGAGDSVASWVAFINSLPAWLDVAVFESPGHGFRKDEQIPDSLVQIADEAYKASLEILQEHKRGGILEGAPFALAGHSMGAQVMIEVAALAQGLLGLEPVCLFPIDRGAPHLPLYTEEGYRLLCMKEPQEFFDGFNPMIGKLMRDPARHKPRTDHERQIRMWIRDVRNCQEHLWSMGQNVFHCPIHALGAEDNFIFDEAASSGKLQALPAEIRRMHELNCKITASGPASSSPWSRESYAAWKEWTTKIGVVHWIKAGHVNIKTHSETARVVTESIAEALGLPQQPS